MEEKFTIAPHRAGFPHIRRDGLRGEEVMAQVHGLVIVPVIGFDGLQFVPIVRAPHC